MTPAALIIFACVSRVRARVVFPRTPDVGVQASSCGIWAKLYREARRGHVVSLEIP